MEQNFYVYLQVRKKDLSTLIIQGRQSSKCNGLKLEYSLLFSDNEGMKLLVKKFVLNFH